MRKILKLAIPNAMGLRVYARGYRLSEEKVVEEALSVCRDFSKDHSMYDNTSCTVFVKTPNIFKIIVYTKLQTCPA